MANEKKNHWINGGDQTIIDQMTKTFVGNNQNVLGDDQKKFGWWWKIFNCLIWQLKLSGHIV